MKLPDFSNFEPLNRMRSFMGAPLIESFSFVSFSRLTSEDLEVMINAGIEIDIEELKVLDDGTLAYKDSRVLLHIRDVSLYHNRGSDDNLPRFHVANCKKLIYMRENNRFDKYVVSIRSDGKFNLNFIDNSNVKTEIRELDICMFCLEALSYKKYPNYDWTGKRKIRDDFSIEEYFSIYPKNLFSTTPRHTSANAPIDNYPSNWNEISERYRSAKDFRCENQGCGVHLRDSQHRRYLHVHHKNGLKHDCSESNLQSLCIYCHAEQPMHSHMKGIQDYKDFLIIRRGLLTTNSGFSAKSQNVLFDHEQDKFEKQDPFAAARKLASENKIDIEDHRAKKGAFWVNYDSQAGALATSLRGLGFRHHAGRGWWKK